MKFKKLFFILSLAINLGFNLTPKTVFSLGQWTEYLDKENIINAKLYAKEKVNIYTETINILNYFKYQFEKIDTNSLDFLYNYIQKKIIFWTKRQFITQKMIQEILSSKKLIDTLLLQTDMLDYEKWEALIKHFIYNQDEKLKCFIVNQHLEELKNTSLFKQKLPEKHLKILQKSLNIRNKQKKNMKYYEILQKQVDSRIHFYRDLFDTSSEYYISNILPLAKNFSNYSCFTQSCIIVDNDFNMPTLFSSKDELKIGHGAEMSAVIKNFKPKKLFIDEINGNYLGEITSKCSTSKTFLNISIDTPGARILFTYDNNSKSYYILLKNALAHCSIFQKFCKFLQRSYKKKEFSDIKKLNQIKIIARELKKENLEKFFKDESKLYKEKGQQIIIESLSNNLVYSFIKVTNVDYFNSLYKEDILNCLKNYSNVAFFAAGNNGLPLTNDKPSLNTIALIENKDIEDVSLVIGNLDITPKNNNICSYDVTSPQPGYAYQNCFVFVPGNFAAYPLDNGAIEFAQNGGTSTATARMTGIASALHEQFFWLDPVIIRWAILVSANRDFENYNPYYHGQGIVDVELAQDFCIEFSHALHALQNKLPTISLTFAQNELLKVLKETWVFSQRERPLIWIESDIVEKASNRILP
jgi:hypothetical protein